jgi:hypothetical protein
VTDNAQSASQTLAELVEARHRARAAVDAIEAEQRTASEAAQAASERLTDLERRALGGEKVSAATRREAEEALAEARAKAAEPWGERIAGAQAALRDATARLQQASAQHLDELVEGLEQDGEAAASKVNEAAAALVAAHQERERVASEISMLCATAGARVRPGDVAYSRAEELARAAAALLDAGGEVPPALRRDPRQPVHGILTDAEVA